MNVITDLERIGYTFTLNGDTIRFTHDGERPDPVKVRPLLEYLKRHKADAVQFIRERFEAEADALLAHCDNSPEWARQWADLAQRAGWPCWGMGWGEWANV